MNESTPPPQFTTVEGKSDDLVTVQHMEGERELELQFPSSSPTCPVQLRFSDGTVLHVFYDLVGIWRVKVKVKGKSLLEVDELPADGIVPAGVCSEVARFRDCLRWAEQLYLGHWIRLR